MSTLEGIINSAVQLPEFLTVEQFAKLLQVSKRTIWRLRSAGQIPQPIQIGGGVRWRMGDIKNWIDRGCPSEQ
jgi:prophage regulatory protein